MSGRPLHRRGCPGGVDPRPAVQILAEEAVLTKPMLAKVLGYRSVRGVDNLIMEDCASDSPCLRPVYLRRAYPGMPRPEEAPSFKSLRFRKEDVLRYIEKMQVDFPYDLEWRQGSGD